MTSSTGRTALITGAGRGIGRAIAIGLAAGGASVGLVARSTDELEAAAEAVRKAGGRAVIAPADLRQRTERDRVVAAITDELGGVDVLINNAAAVRPLGASHSLNMDEWAEAFELNVIAPAALSFAVLPAMLDRGWGRIVNVSTAAVANPAGMVGGNAYVASKAALEAHTINLAAEISGSGVTVNVYRPGTVDTAMQGWIRDQDPAAIGAALHDRFVRSHRDGRLITPEDSAQALLSRLFDDGSGQIWDVADHH